MTTPTVALTTDNLQNAANQLRNGTMDTSAVDQNQDPLSNMLTQDGNLTGQMGVLTGQAGDIPQANAANAANAQGAGCGGGAAGANAQGAGCGGGGAGGANAAGGPTQQQVEGLANQNLPNSTSPNTQTETA